jgi:hypothetical protein
MSTKTAHRHHTSHTDTASAGERPAGNDPPATANASPEERFHLIQVRAYGLWEQAGKPNDDESRVRFWNEAEKAITVTCCTEN